MNVGTGALYEVRDGFMEAAVGSFNYATTAELTGRQLERQGLGELLEDERRMLEDLARGDTIVPVSGEVAQIVKLGTRERERRRRRAKAARDARKRNRG